MGYYINKGPNGEPIGKFGKRTAIRTLFNGTEVPRPPDKALICVDDKGFYDAAVYVYDAKEFDRILWHDIKGQSQYTWLLIDKEQVNKVTGFDR